MCVCVGGWGGGTAEHSNSDMVNAHLSPLHAFFGSIALTKQNFTLKYDTNIPRQVVSVYTTVSIFKGSLCDI